MSASYRTPGKQGDNPLRVSELGSAQKSHSITTQQKRLICHAANSRDVVTRYEDDPPSSSEVADVVAQADALAGVQSGFGFVEEQQFRDGDQRHGQGAALAHSFAQLRDRLIEIEVDAGVLRGDSDLVITNARGEGGHAQQPAHRPGRVQNQRLRQVADAVR
jgi:hypothetical protein